MNIKQSNKSIGMAGMLLINLVRFGLLISKLINEIHKLWNT